MYDFARKYEYYNTIWETLGTTEDYEQLHEYASLKWEELNNDRVINRKDFFTKNEALESLYSLVSKLEIDLDIPLKGDLLVRKQIINALESLRDYDIDIIDIVNIIRVAFYNADMAYKTEITVSDFMESIELSYLDENIKDIVINKLRMLTKNKVQKGNKIIKLR